jgi:ribonuclease HI
MQKPTKIHDIYCYFDGAVQPHNPGGHGGYGISIVNHGIEVYSEAAYIGQWRDLSNNVAEYAGAISVLRYLLSQGHASALVRGDSMLVIQQLKGRWKAKSGVYLPYYQEAWALRAKLPEVDFEWIPRERNGRADDLSKVALDKRVIGFALDPSVAPVAPPKIAKRRRTRDCVADLESLWSN